ncbi:MAG: UbiX family flavin prenyltransferase [Thermoplasmata archaeon]
MGEGSGPIVVGLSGASGMPIAVRTLAALREAGERVSLIVSEGAGAVLREESGIEPEALAAYATDRYSDRDLAAPIASGSRPTRGMVIVPCSSTMVARIALGLGDGLIARAAHVHLKERRRLVIVPRETPLSPILLGHLTRLAELGVVVLPPEPAYYLHPARIEEVTDFLAGRVLDHLGIAHRLYRGWKVGEEP